jgi:hypothetical protein
MYQQELGFQETCALQLYYFADEQAVITRTEDELQYKLWSFIYYKA